MDCLLFVDQSNVMGFLTEHARLAWKIAVHNCKLIADGLIDLEQKKLFVSSFQNATELCLKQYLLDTNNMSILHSRMIRAGSTNQRRIYNNCQRNASSSSPDLNSFFQGLTSADLNEIRTSDFTVVVDEIFNSSNTMTPNVTDIKDLLVKQRNNETHFYIDDSAYLSFNEYQSLCRLMKTLQNYFISLGILESASPSINQTNKKYLGYFDLDPDEMKSYKDFVENSETNLRLIAQILPFETKATVQKWGIPRGWQFYVSDRDDYYSIAHEMFEHSGIQDGDGICFDFKMNLDELYRRLILWAKYGMVRIDKNTVRSGNRKVDIVYVCQAKRITTKLKKMAP